MSDGNIFDFRQVINTSLVMVMAHSEAYFNMVSKHIRDIPQTELMWFEDKIEALAGIFMEKPKVLIVFCDSNQDTLAFVRLVRNNPSFRELPVLAIFAEPLKFKHKWMSGLNLAGKFETPIPPGIRQEVESLLEKKEAS